MLQLRCTGKVQKDFNIKLSNLSEIKEYDSLLGNWYVNTVIISREKMVFFMNEKTLLSFIFYGLKKSNISLFHEIFLKGLNNLLLSEDFDYLIVNKINHQYLNLEFTKTNNKSLLGNMNDLINLYENFISNSNGISCDIGQIIRRINRIPRKTLQWKKSIEVVKQILS